MDPISPSGQLIDPAMRLREKGNQGFIGRRGFALRGTYNQLCLDTAALQQNGDGKVEQPFQMRCAPDTIPVD